MHLNLIGCKQLAHAIITSTVLLSSAWSMSSLASELTPQPQTCTDILDYQLTYKGSNVGKIQRQQVWQGHDIKASTSGRVSFLMFKFSGSHHAQLSWSPIQQRYLTREYTQDVKGFSDTSTQAHFSENSLNSKLTLNGESKDYSDLEQPIVDFEAIAVQMRHYLMTQSASEFDFVLQKSDKTSRYYFQAQGEETIKVKGQDIKAIKISQVRKKDRKLHLWFAPELNYQLVKASYKRKIIDIEAELTQRQLECQN
ncbi:DUF3108 domain-containing protein [Motilimonas sp. KMU-193]|uniref:DUF3108 domain-containing protein n=1 Tax=Motilimonas sp. KMU-193 TaxID=3388668 RepID=UPI00396B3EE8